MGIELDDDEAELLLDLHDAFRDDLVQALMDIEDNLHDGEVVLTDLVKLDESIDGFKRFTGEFKGITGQKIQEADDA